MISSRRLLLPSVFDLNIDFFKPLYNNTFYCPQTWHFRFTTLKELKSIWNSCSYLCSFILTQQCLRLVTFECQGWSTVFPSCVGVDLFVAFQFLLNHDCASLHSYFVFIAFVLGVYWLWCYWNFKLYLYCCTYKAKTSQLPSKFNFNEFAQCSL